MTKMEIKPMQKRNHTTRGLTEKYDMTNRQFSRICSLVMLLPLSAIFNIAHGTYASANSQHASRRILTKSRPHLALPTLLHADLPLYPAGARHANIQGFVQVKITTDGQRVIAASAQGDSHPLLARAAETNLLTWQFATHPPTSFMVTFHYKLVRRVDPTLNNPRVILRLPIQVEVDAPRWVGTVDTPAKIK